MKIVLISILGIHALLHLLGFYHAFSKSGVRKFTQPISRITGILWSSVTLLLLASCALAVSDNPLWWLLAAITLPLSQILIIKSWTDAKAGTLVNVMLLLFITIGAGTWMYSNRFNTDVRRNIADSQITEQLLTENDIQNLPVTVKNYIRYTGALNKPRVNSFYVQFTGRIRDYNKKEWMEFESVQYNFQKSGTRLFFMNATMKHLPVAGYHCFQNGSAFMDIRLLSLFTVQYQSGPEMNIAETVTLFNDMCVMAPATLVDPRITWTEIDSLHTNASFTNNGITIEAQLIFNAEGELINFISEDRYALVGEEMQQLQWSTPLRNYKDVNGVKLSTEAEAVYMYPTGAFSYGEFNLVNVIYNPESLVE